MRRAKTPLPFSRDLSVRSIINNVYVETKTMVYLQRLSSLFLVLLFLSYIIFLEVIEFQEKMRTSDKNDASSFQQCRLKIYWLNDIVLRHHFLIFLRIQGDSSCLNFACANQTLDWSHARNFCSSQAALKAVFVMSRVCMHGFPCTQSLFFHAKIWDLPSLQCLAL